MRHCRKWDSSGPTQTRSRLSVILFLEHQARVEQSSKRASIPAISPHPPSHPSRHSVRPSARKNTFGKENTELRQTTIHSNHSEKNNVKKQQQTFFGPFYERKKNLYSEREFIHLLVMVGLSYISYFYNSYNILMYLYHHAIFIIVT